MTRYADECFRSQKGARLPGREATPRQVDPVGRESHGDIDSIIDEKSRPGLSGRGQKFSREFVQISGDKIFLPELDCAHPSVQGLSHDGKELAAARLMAIGDQVQTPLFRISKFEFRTSNC